MSETILLLRLEHRHADDLLKLMAQQLEQDSPVDVDLMQSIVDYFSDYPDQCHHPIEDLVYRKLCAKAPKRAAELGGLLEEHQKIAEKTALLASTLQKARVDEGVRAGELREVMQKFVRGYRAHMSAEEKKFFPMALETLSRDDWSELEFDLFDRRDPLFDNEVEERFNELREKIEIFATTSYKRAAFLRKTRQLQKLTSIEAFNDMESEAGGDYRLVPIGAGGYGLQANGETIIDIPECSPARAAWCAYFFLESRANHVS